MTVPLQRSFLVLGAAALCVAAPAARMPLGAQAAQGGGRVVERTTRQLTEEEQRRIAQVRRDLERAVERARSRVSELRERNDYSDAEARALRQAYIVLEQAEPATPEFTASMARLHALAEQDELRFFEDRELKGALKDMSRLQGELAVRARARAQRGYLGVTFSSERQVGPGGRITFTVDEYPEILSVETNSPAWQAGVRRGDVLLAMNGRDLVRQGPIPLSDMLRPGENVRLRLRRGRETTERTVRVGVAEEVRVFMASPGDAAIYGGVLAPTPPVPPATPGTPGAAPVPRAPRPLRVETVRPGEMPGNATFIWTPEGVSITSILGAQMMHAMDRDQRDVLDVDHGVLVLHVQPRSLAAQSDLHSFDVVQRVDGEPVRTPDELRAAIAQAQRNGARSVVLTVVRKQKEEKVTLSWR